MSLLTLPLIAWGSADDVSAAPWTDGGVVVASGFTDPFGGTAAYSLQDDSAGATEYRRKPITFTADGVQLIYGCFRQNPTDQTSQALFQIVDETASAERGGVIMTFSGTTMTASIYGAATAVASVAIGDSWYLAWAVVPGILKANTNSIRIYPASASASATGTMRVYMRPMVLLDYPGAYRRFARPRDGYMVAVSGSGTRDAWSQGTEYARRFTAHWIPPSVRSSPVTVSGYNGAHETTGVNAGVEAMLLAGMNMDTLRWVPDRSNCRVYQDVYLASPSANWEPTEEPNGDFAVDLELVTPSAPAGVA